MPLGQYVSKPKHELDPLWREICSYRQKKNIDMQIILMAKAKIFLLQKDRL